MSLLVMSLLYRDRAAQASRFARTSVWLASRDNPPRMKDDDIELHFFPAEALAHHHNASFAAWVLDHAVKLAG
jgi:hypothetical protein